tara:strand:- start:1613 stop:1786 length:174 start_codon:yes stop_codon:yes gene_type:complete
VKIYTHDLVVEDEIDNETAIYKHLASRGILIILARCLSVLFKISSLLGAKLEIFINV